MDPPGRGRFWHRAQGTGHRAQSTEHRAQSTGHRAQSTEHRAQSTGRKNDVPHVASPRRTPLAASRSSIHN